MPENKKINLTSLNVNTENYRFEPVASQKEALNLIIEDQGEKLYNLAEDISKNGLNPNEMIQVSPSSHDKTRYNVLEGNRRIAALKILSNPEIIDDPEKNSLKNKFKKLHEEQKTTLYTEIECLVYNTPADADKWIKLKHTGENNGIGVVTWSPQQIARFNEKVDNKSSTALQTIKLLKNSKDVPIDIKNRLGELKTTNLDRLLSDPGVRDLLGIEINNGIIESAVSEKEVIKGLTQVAKDLLEPSFNVKKIYTKEDRKDYIRTFNPASKPNTTIKASKPWCAPANSTSSSPSTKSKPLPLHRRYLIPKKCAIKISNQKVNSIYYELRKLDVTKFTNASAVLLRVFVELSIDCYSTQHNLPLIDRNGKYIKLKTKIETVLTKLEATKQEYKIPCKGIKMAINNKNNILGIDTLHAYVHNAHFSPKPEDLTKSWDNIEEFIKIVWENI